MRDAAVRGYVCGDVFPRLLRQSVIGQLSILCDARSVVLGGLLIFRKEDRVDLGRLAIF